MLPGRGMGWGSSAKDEIPQGLGLDVAETVYSTREAQTHLYFVHRGGHPLPPLLCWGSVLSLILIQRICTLSHAGLIPEDWTNQLKIRKIGDSQTFKTFTSFPSGF